MTVVEHIVEHEILGLASVKKGDGVIDFYINGVKVAQLTSSGNFKIAGGFLAEQTL